MTSARRFRELLRSQHLVVAPGAYDGMTTRLVDQAGFDAVYMTGAGTAAAHGYPDYGLITASEMVANASRMANATSLPIIADADTGYGNELNVTRTVRDFEKAGVAAIHIEDQLSPKRCGHLDGKQVIPADEFASKIAAAVAARRDPDFLIIARTDARAIVGLDEAIARANAALDAGADMAFVEAAQSVDELAEITRRVHGPCLLNVVPGGKTPTLSYEDARQMGYRLALCPGVLLRTFVSAADEALAALKKSGLPTAGVGGDAPVSATFQRFGAGEWDALRERFAKRTV